MKFRAPSPIIEMAAEWIAACCLGGAVGFACLRVAPGGVLLAGGGALAVAAAALVLMGLVDGAQRVLIAGFEPDVLGAIDTDEETGDALLLDEPVELPILLLDEPVVVDESRVVRLFTAGPAAAEDAAAIPEPGEMLARIEKFLGATRCEEIAVPAWPANAASAEASAALHAALADIRRSLRQG